MKTLARILGVLALALGVAGALRPVIANAQETDPVLEGFKVRAKAEFEAKGDPYLCDATVVGEEKDGPGRLIHLQCSNTRFACVFVVSPKADEPGGVVAHPVSCSPNPDYKPLIKSGSHAGF